MILFLILIFLPILHYFTAKIVFFFETAKKKTVKLLIGNESAKLFYSFILQHTRLTLLFGGFWPPFPQSLPDMLNINFFFFKEEL